MSTAPLTPSWGSLAAGQRYWWRDPAAPDRRRLLVHIVGRDPRSGRWVGSSQHWGEGLSYISREDLRCMRLADPPGSESARRHTRSRQETPA